MRIKLTTSGLPVGRNVRARKPDMDHARDIIEYTERGYHVAARADDGWSLHFFLAPPFVNSPEGAEKALIMHTYFMNDVTAKHPPEWCERLIAHIDSIKPANVHFAKH